MTSALANGKRPMTARITQNARATCCPQSRRRRRRRRAGRAASRPFTVSWAGVWVVVMTQTVSSVDHAAAKPGHAVLLDGRGDIFTLSFALDAPEAYFREVDGTSQAPPERGRDLTARPRLRRGVVE